MHTFTDPETREAVASGVLNVLFRLQRINPAFLARIDLERVQMCDGTNCPLGMMLRIDITRGWHVCEKLWQDSDDDPHYSGGAACDEHDCLAFDADRFITWWDAAGGLRGPETRVRKVLADVVRAAAGWP